MEPLAATVYTIGYGSGDFDQLVSRMRDTDIRFIVDVRTNAYSNYQEDFRGKPMADRFEKAGYRYIYLGDRVGGKPPWPEVIVDGEIDPDRLRKAPLFQQGVAKIAEAAQSGKTLCLMCGCAKPDQCHRGRVLCAELLEIGIESIHLLVDGSRITQTELTPRLEPRQHRLFE